MEQFEMEQVGTLVILVLFTVGVSWFVGRRKWLAKGVGTFDCGISGPGVKDGQKWSFGFARFNENTLQWFRVFATNLQPTLVFDRREMTILSVQASGRMEEAMLARGMRIIMVITADHKMRLAMPGGVVPRMANWVTNAPLMEDTSTDSAPLANDVPPADGSSSVEDLPPTPDTPPTENA